MLSPALRMDDIFIFSFKSSVILSMIYCHSSKLFMPFTGVHTESFIV